MFNSNLFNIGIMLLPQSLRKEKIIAWVKTFLGVIKSLTATFTTYRTEKLFFIAHTSQVIFLEHILNHYFNPDGTDEDPDYEGNGIYITDGQTADEVFIYNTAEGGDDTFLYNSSEAPFDEVYLNNNSQYSPFIGFVINIPDTFMINENKLKSLVNNLKLAGKRYVLNYYTI